MALSAKIKSGVDRYSRTKGGEIKLDVSDLLQTMDEFSKEMNRSKASTLRMVGGNLVTELKRITPIAPRVTKLLWFHGPTGDLMSRVKKTPSCPHGRGFARYTWQIAGEKAKVKKMNTSTFVPGTTEAGEGSVITTSTGATLTLTNNANYIRKLDAQYRIVDGAIHNTAYRLLQAMTKSANSAVSKAITKSGGRVV